MFFFFLHKVVVSQAAISIIMFVFYIRLSFLKQQWWSTSSRRRRPRDTPSWTRLRFVGLFVLGVPKNVSLSHKKMIFVMSDGSGSRMLSFVLSDGSGFRIMSFVLSDGSGSGARDEQHWRCGDDALRRRHAAQPQSSPPRPPSHLQERGNTGTRQAAQV